MVALMAMNLQLVLACLAVHNVLLGEKSSLIGAHI